MKTARVAHGRAVAVGWDGGRVAVRTRRTLDGAGDTVLARADGADNEFRADQRAERERWREAR